MGTLTYSPKAYGGLLATTLPKVVETDRELEHFAEVLESLERLGRELRPEEKTLEALLSRLVRDYDEKIEPAAAAAAQDRRVSDGTARAETRGFAAGVWVAKRCVGGSESEAGAEQESYSEAGGVFSVSVGVFF